MNFFTKKLMILASVGALTAMMTGCGGSEDGGDNNQNSELTQHEQDELNQYSYSETEGGTINLGDITKTSNGDIIFNVKNFKRIEEGKKIIFTIQPYTDLTYQDTSMESFVGSARFECNGDANIRCVDVKTITCDRVGISSDNKYTCYLNNDKSLSTTQMKKIVKFNKTTSYYDDFQGGQVHSDVLLFGSIRSKVKYLDGTIREVETTREVSYTHFFNNYTGETFPFDVPTSKRTNSSEGNVVWGWSREQSYAETNYKLRAEIIFKD